jgi:hypothetical protein
MVSRQEGHVRNDGRVLGGVAGGGIGFEKPDVDGFNEDVQQLPEDQERAVLPEGRGEGSGPDCHRSVLQVRVYRTHFEELYRIS